MDCLRPRFERWTSPDHPTLWVLSALAVKGFFFLLKVGGGAPETHHFPSSLAFEAPDTVSYLGPIENLLLTGEYQPDQRMPGYGWVYLLLRLALPTASALGGLAVIQLALSAVSVFYLAKIALRVFGKPYFYAVFAAYALSTYTSLWDAYLLTESFAVAALIFSVHLLLDARDSETRVALSGLFLTWGVFLRPVVAPLLGLFALYLVLKSRRLALVFLIPFLALDGLWMARNLNKHGVASPLTSYQPKGERDNYFGALMRFMHAFGGSIVFWAPGAEITFFKPLPEYLKVRGKEVELPEEIYTSRFDRRSLVEVRELVREVEDPATPEERRSAAEKEAIERLDAYTASIKAERPFLYHISSRLRPMKSFFVHSGTYNLFDRPSRELSWPEFLVKAAYSGLYVLVVVFGFPGSLWLLLLRDKDAALLSLMTLFLALVHPLLLKRDEFRFFVTAYPFMLLAAVFTVVRMWKSLGLSRYNPQTVR